MLYLPPGVPHHGVAEDACLTFSVGMRAPAAAELLGDFVDTLASEADESLRFADPDLEPAKDACEIDAAAMERVVEALNTLRMNDPARLGEWFGRFITTYRTALRPGGREEGGDGRSRIEIEWDLQQGAWLRRDAWTRMAWQRVGRGAKVFVSGESHALPLADARRIAGNERLGGSEYAKLSITGRDLVQALLQDGHYALEQPGDDVA
jgi:50S ribosomal protein L16 3-hydroxylase